MNIKKLLSAAASIITAGALIVGGTMAYFTSTDTNTGNILGSGTLDIQLQDLLGAPLEGPLFNVNNMMPDGPSVFACAAVANIGSFDFNYSLKGVETAATTPSLADVLWGKSYTWIGEGAPTSLADCNDGTKWQLVFDPIWVPTGELPVSPLLGVEAKQGLLASGAKDYYRWEYYLPGVLTTQPGNVVVPDQNDYQGKNTVLTFEAKAYQTTDPAYDAL